MRGKDEEQTGHYSRDSRDTEGRRGAESIRSDEDERTRPLRPKESSYLIVWTLWIADGGDGEALSCVFCGRRNETLRFCLVFSRSQFVSAGTVFRLRLLLRSFRALARSFDAYREPLGRHRVSFFLLFVCCFSRSWRVPLQFQPALSAGLHPYLRHLETLMVIIYSCRLNVD